MPDQLPPLPLVHNGDSYILELSRTSATLLLLSRILRYDDNKNCDATDVRFFDLDPQTREAVLAQIQRRYRGVSVKV